MIHVKKNVDNFGERLRDCLKYGAGEKCTVNSLTALGGKKHWRFLFITNSLWSPPEVHVFGFCCARQ